MTDIDLIAAAMENIGFSQRNAIGGSSFQLNLQQLLTVLEHVITRSQFPFGLVIRHPITSQPGLGQIQVFSAIVEKHEIF